MATFNTFSDILPDPIWRITEAGNYDPAGIAGPGFAKVKLSSVRDTQLSRTISGRGIHREGGSHHWEISIAYNPMLREQFEPVYSFLIGRNSRLNPFYVELPQLAPPRDPAFNVWAAGKPITVPATNAGASSIMISFSLAAVGTPKPGDIFRLLDGTNVNHQKVYQVTRVETNALYQAGTTQPTTSQFRIHFNPPLERNVAAGANLTFHSVKFRVVTKGDIIEYDLNTDNLYSFGLDLEEIQP